jgi:putative aminopeptidase FrvX
MHSANEVVSLSDVTNVGSLLAATLRRLDVSDLRHTVEVFRKK